MLNNITVDEAVEISGLSALAIRNAVRKGMIIGSHIENRGRNTYRITRYAFYRLYLGWNDAQIDEYHNSERGQYWLNYDSSANRRKNTKKEPTNNVDPYVN